MIKLLAKILCSAHRSMFTAEEYQCPSSPTCQLTLYRTHRNCKIIDQKTQHKKNQSLARREDRVIISEEVVTLLKTTEAVTTVIKEINHLTKLARASGRIIPKARHGSKEKAIFS